MCRRQKLNATHFHTVSSVGLVRGTRFLNAYRVDSQQRKEASRPSLVIVKYIFLKIDFLMVQYCINSCFFFFQNSIRNQLLKSHNLWLWKQDRTKNTTRGRRTRNYLYCPDKNQMRKLDCSVRDFPFRFQISWHKMTT